MKATLPMFTAASKSYRSWEASHVTARDRMYLFIHALYMAYLEGKKKPEAYEQKLESLFGKVPPSGPHKKRPMLRLLQATLYEATGSFAPNEMRPQISKVVGCLEMIERHFKDKRAPSVASVVKYIRENGGTTGLYQANLSFRLKKVNRPIPTKRTSDPEGEVIDLPNIGAAVVRRGQGFKLRLTGLPPGEYDLCVRVGRDGTVSKLFFYEDDEKVA